MKKHIIQYLWLFLTGTALLAQDDRPILKESPARLVACMQSTARADLAAARVNVTRDVTQKKLRLFAVSISSKVGSFQVGDYSVEVIYDSDIATEHKTAGGPYHHHHNATVLAFAAAQFIAGKKQVGVAIAKLISEAEPDLCWSSPTHPIMTIHQILLGLEKEDSTVTDFLKEEREEWLDITKSGTNR